MKFSSFGAIRSVDLLEVRCSTYATLIIFLSTAILAVAFVTPFWLESETIPDQRFKRLGLWEACFAKMHDHHYRYDRVVSGCKWIFDEDYAFLIDFLEPISSAKTRRNIEQQQRQAAIRAKFGAEASQLRLTIYFILAVALVLTAIAFFSPNWLEAERRYYGSKFRKLGLWRMCFNSFSAPDDLQFKKFYVGCRWIFADEYKLIRKFLLPTFFIITQVLYTAGFILLVLVSAGILAVQQCFIIEREDYALRALSIASLLSGVSCTSAVIIFAIYGNRYDWMPDPEHNYYSWSFAAAVLGSVLLWIAALLFYIEMQLTIRREMRQRSSYSPR